MNINIKDFWTMPVPEQQKITDELADIAEQEAMNAAHKIRYRGRWIDPAQYPCQCKLEDPSACQHARHPKSPRVCKCRCHTHWRG